MGSWLEVSGVFCLCCCFVSWPRLNDAFWRHQNLQIVTYIKMRITLGNIIVIQQFVAQIFALRQFRFSESALDHRPDHNCRFQSTPLRRTHSAHTPISRGQEKKCHSKGEWRQGRNNKWEWKSKAVTKRQSQRVRFGQRRRHKIQRGSGEEPAELSGGILSIGTQCDSPLSLVSSGGWGWERDMGYCVPSPGSGAGNLPCISWRSRLLRLSGVGPPQTLPPQTTACLVFAVGVHLESYFCCRDERRGRKSEGRYAWFSCGVSCLLSYCCYASEAFCAHLAHTHNQNCVRLDTQRFEMMGLWF